MHQQHLAGDIGEIERLFDRGIAAADHDHLLAAVEEAVAGGAGRHAVAQKAVLGGQPEIARLGAGGDDQGVGGVFGMAVAFEPERAALEIGRDDVVVDHLGADMLGLEPHLLHQPRALDHVGEAGIVLDVGGGGHLAAGVDALDKERLHHGARGVDARGVAGGARADDDQFGVAGGHGASSLTCKMEDKR